MRRLLGVAAVLAVIAGIAVGITSCGGGHHKTHQATCWKPSYAAAPTASWAKHPSATHRHGKGPRGTDICDPK